MKTARVKLDAQACDEHELFSWGALSPLTGYLSQRDLAAVRGRGQLCDGTPWRFQWTLRATPGTDKPDEAVLLQPEGQRIGTVQVSESWTENGVTFLSGTVQLECPPDTGAFRALRRRPPAMPDTPDQVALVVDRGLRPANVLGALALAKTTDKPLLLMPFVGAGELGVGPTTVTAVRIAHSVATRFPDQTRIAAIPIANDWWQSEELRWLARRTASRFGVHALLSAQHAMPMLEQDGTTRILPCPETPAEDRWLRDGLEAVLAAHPQTGRAGLVVLFTGLPAAGKSTLARGLRDSLLTGTERTVTLLDGDLVRATLSPDLTFSRADRLRNMSRLAAISAECARHGGVVICAPVAPYQEGRTLFRRVIGEVANLLLVYVATPVDECARRDPKGLYARAMSGQLTGMTGVDDPYEPPADADLVVGHAGESTDEAVRRVLALLIDRKWVSPASWSGTWGLDQSQEMIFPTEFGTVRPCSF